MKITPLVPLVIGHLSWILLFVSSSIFPLLTTVGWILCVIGALFASGGQIYFTLIKKWKGRTTEKDAIWTNGPFRIIRHPMYGGLIMTWIGITFSIVYRKLTQVDFPIKSWLIILGLLFCIKEISTLVKMSIEQEKELLKTHGEEAEAYFKKVKYRWLPFLI